MSTKFNLEYPYNKRWKSGYLVTNGDNRKTVILVNNKDDRSSTQYARYLISVKLKRFLNKDEHVDHKDDDKTNDSIDNLQLLTCKENNIKTFKQPDVELVCPVCGTEFKRTLTQLRGRKEKAEKNMIACSRYCGGKLSHITKNNRQVVTSSLSGDTKLHVYSSTV